MDDEKIQAIRKRNPKNKMQNNKNAHFHNVLQAVEINYYNPEVRTRAQRYI